MAGRRRRRLTLTGLCAGVVAIPFVRMAVVAAQLPRTSIPWGADNYELLVEAQAASRFAQLTGPWSRLGFTHPGPLLAYWEAPWFLLMGGATTSLMVAAAVLGGACLATLVAVVGARTSPAGAALAAVVVLAGVARASIIGFTHPWNPATTIAAAALMVVVAAAVSSGSTRLLPVAVLVGSFLAQTHLGAAPFAVVLTVVALAGWVRRREGPWRRDAGWVAGAVAVGLLVWLPVGIDQVRGTHNVSRVIRFAADGEVTSDDYGVLAPDTGHQVGPLEAVRWTAATSSGWQPSASIWAGSDGVSGMHARPRDASLLVLAGLVGVNAWAARRSRWSPPTPTSSFLGALSRFAIGGAALAVVAAWSSRGDFRPYLIAFSVGVGLTLWLGAVLAVAHAHRETIRRLARPLAATTLGRAAAGIVGAAVVIGLLVPSLMPRHAAFPSTDAESEALLAAIEDQLPQGFDGRVEIGGQGWVQYPHVVQLVFEMEADGVRTQVPERFQLRVATPQQTDAEPDLRFVLGGTTDTPPKGCEPLPLGDRGDRFDTTLCVIGLG